MMENLLMATASSGGNSELASWVDSKIPTTPTAYSRMFAGGTTMSTYAIGTGWGEEPRIVGGWNSSSKGKIGNIESIKLMNTLKVELNDSLRIDAEQVMVLPIFKKRNVVGSALYVETAWVQQGYGPGSMLTFTSGEVGSQGTTPITAKNGFIVTYLGKEQTSATAFVFAGAGDGAFSSLHAWPRSDSSKAVKLTDFPIHHEYSRTVVSLDGETAFVIGGCDADGPSGLVTSFNMREVSSLPVGPTTFRVCAPMPVPVSKGIAYLDNDGDTITYIGGNKLGSSKENSLVLDDSSDLIQRYNISKNEWSVEEVRFLKKLVGATLIITSKERYICYGLGNPENKIYKSLRSDIN